jgi:hypothetical protein
MKGKETTGEIAAASAHPITNQVSSPEYGKLFLCFKT